MNLLKSKLWIVVTIVVALVLSVLVFQYLTNLREEAGGQNMTTVVVATQKITQGTRLTGSMVKTVRMPAKYSPDGAVTSLLSVLNKQATVDLWPEEVLIAGQLTTPEKSKEVLYKIPDGYRAITIAVNPVSGVAGLIKPGNHVDVFVFVKPDQGEPKVSTLMEKATVLAVGANLQKKPEEEALENMTLAVLPQQAQAITMAENVGKLKVALVPENEVQIQNQPAPGK